MDLRSKVVTPNAALVVSLADFKQEIKWSASDTSEDTSMTTNIQAATMQAEAFTRRTISSAPWKSTTDLFYGSIVMDVLPIVQASIVVKYYDENNTIQTLASSEYTIQDNGDDDYVEIVFDGTMPNVYDRYDAVQIEYNAGYSTLPAGIKKGILLMAATYFENRQNEIVGSSSASIMFGSHQVLYPYKMMG